jgi:hypothetical protein
LWITTYVRHKKTAGGSGGFGDIADLLLVMLDDRARHMGNYHVGRIVQDQFRMIGFVGRFVIEHRIQTI